MDACLSDIVEFLRDRCSSPSDDDNEALRELEAAKTNVPEFVRAALQFAADREIEIAVEDVVGEVLGIAWELNYDLDQRVAIVEAAAPWLDETDLELLRDEAREQQ